MSQSECTSRHKQTGREKEGFVGKKRKKQSDQEREKKKRESERAVGRLRE